MKKYYLDKDIDIKGDIARRFVEALGLCARSFKRSDEAGDDNNSKGMCTTCKDVCSYFPLQDIIQYPYFCECAEYIEVYEIASKRKGGREMFRKRSHELSFFVNESFAVFELKNDKSDEEEALRRRLADLGMSHEDKEIWYLRKSDLVDLDRRIAVGYNPRSVSKETLYEVLQIGRSGREFDVFAKSTVDALVARGFALDEADLIVLDERMEPGLKDLPALIRGERHDDDDDDDHSSAAS